MWRYRRGTNDPQFDWRTTGDVSLDETWLTGPGGIGYGDPGIQGEATMLTGMRNVHSTLYVRREFNLAADINSAAELRLVIDYDDGFVMYLDGIELTRRNVAGASNSPVTPAAQAILPHEASCCTAPMNPISTIGLGAVGNRLNAGAHVLAFIAMSDDTNSSDFHLIPDLVVSAAPSGSVINNGAYALTTSNSLPLAGTNTIPGSARVTVNGDDAAFNSGQGTWSMNRALNPGWNHLFIAALDTNGNILTNVTQDVVFETSGISISGTLSASVLASNRGTVLHVTDNVVVPTNVTLEIADGVVVLVEPARSIIAQNGGHLNVHGSFDDKVFFHLNGSTNSTWGPLAAVGTNSTIQVQFAEVAHAQVSATGGATGLIEDTAIHDFDPGSAAGTLGRPIMLCNFASLFQARRVHVWNYYECLVRNGLIQIEDCVFESIVGDALDFDSAQPGSYTRRCTYRNGTLGNVDAVDIGPADLPGSTDTLIADCIMWNFPFDKGVSVGDGGSSHGIIVSNCLIYGCNAGVMSKDLCDVSVRNCTVVNNTSGFTNYNKGNPASATGGGVTTNSYNNILWNNITTIGLANNGQVFADHNNFGNTNWPGAANIDVDPLFVDAAAHNFRLQPDSPVRGAGRDGADMGISYPIGGIPLPPLRLAALASSNGPTLTWIDDSQNENGVIVQRSADATLWQTIATLAAEATNYTDATVALGQKFYYRAQHTNYVGISPFSNIASGVGQSVEVPDAFPLHIAFDSGAVHLWFAAQSNRAYTVDYIGSLIDTQWLVLSNIASEPLERTVSITNSVLDAARYYRARTP